MIEAPAQRYPARLSIDYPERQSRWKAFFRIILATPLLLAIAFLYYTVWLVILLGWLFVLIRGRLPRWLFDFEVGFSEFYLRANAYLLLLTDEYAPFDAFAAVRYTVDYPIRVSRWKLLFWKFLTAVPHLIALQLLNYAQYAVAVVGWFAIVFSGTYPKALHEFSTGVMRWGARVWAYAISLTDVFPPYSLDPNAGPAGRTATLVSGAAGAFLGLSIAGIITAVLFAYDWESDPVVVTVSYDSLAAGAGFEDTFAETALTAVSIDAAVDPADDLYAFLAFDPGSRLVEFQLSIEYLEVNNRLRLDNQDFIVRSSAGDHDALVVAIDSHDVAPATIESGEFAFVTAVFELPLGINPSELEFEVNSGFLWYDGERIIWQFE
jgi:hypothetical protein